MTTNNKTPQAEIVEKLKALADYFLGKNDGYLECCNEIAKSYLALVEENERLKELVNEKIETNADIRKERDQAQKERDQAREDLKIAEEALEFIKETEPPSGSPRNSTEEMVFRAEQALAKISSPKTYTLL